MGGTAEAKKTHAGAGGAFPVEKGEKKTMMDGEGRHDMTIRGTCNYDFFNSFFSCFIYTPTATFHSRRKERCIMKKKEDGASVSGEVR